MSKEYIKIVQNILKKKNDFDLAIKLENSHYSFIVFQEEYDWQEGTLNLYVHPNYYIELLDTNLDNLKKIFQGLFESNQHISNIEIKINKEIQHQDINNTVYIFVDEAGDMDFSSKGSKHYMFNFLIKKRPFNLHEYISNYRYSLLERNLDPFIGRRLDIEAFHACEDNKYIREEIFNIISTFDKQSVQAYSYILEKTKVDPKKRREKDKFYIDNLNLAIHQLLDKLQIDNNFVIITDRLPVQKNKSKQVGALKKGIKEYIKFNNLKIRYDIFHHCSASSANLQIVDYISWAIFRKYEQGQDIFYKKIEKYLIGIDLMTKNRDVNHYEK